MEELGQIISWPIIAWIALLLILGLAALLAIIDRLTR